MTINAGTRLGPYEIVAPLGAGGMGEVYKARDTRLDRSVAVKILPSDFAANAQLKLRFAREAKTISQLSHPNICTLFDVGEDYLVMELLEGESLADRIARGPMPFADVLRYGAQIADGLAQAHRAGIVHRDLKPGNVMITKSGAKLLDFGLAKTTANALDLDVATQHKPITQEGSILGTFQYMAPEQIEGLEADARSDIFALGALLYEMATGRRAFEGKTKTSLIAAIVGGTPRPLSELQPLTPLAFEHVVAKCLEKEPDARWQSAHDVAEELRWIGQVKEVAPAARRSIFPWLLAATFAVLAIALTIALVARRPRPARITYTEISAPENANFQFDNGAAALSPDGTMIVFPAVEKNGNVMLWLRRFNSEAAQPLRGTENALFPFWSPDSKSIAYFVDTRLRRIEISTGAQETISEATITGRGGSWSKDGTIVFTPTPADGLYAVPFTGGERRQVTTLNVERGDTSHRFPTFLPDGRHFIAFVQGANERNVLLGSLDSKQTRLIATADGAPFFVEPDLLMFIRDRILRAERLDMKTYQPIGDPIPVAESMQVNHSINSVNVSASQNGVLAYVSGSSATESRFTWFDPSGKLLGTIGPTADQLDPRISRDGQTVLASVSGASGLLDIWAYDVRRDIQTRVTSSPANEFGPVWSPDNKSFVYTSFEHSPGDLMLKRVDEATAGRVLLADKRRKVSSDWTRDGKWLIFQALTPGRAWDVYGYSTTDGKVVPLITTASAEYMAHVSPDQKWIAYTSVENNRNHVFVQRFPPTGERWQVSSEGGTAPNWRPDSKLLYYIGSDGKLMSAAVHIEGSQFATDAPKEAFPVRIKAIAGVTRCQYDVASDGRLLINSFVSDPSKPLTITIVQNWTEKLKGQ